MEFTIEPRLQAPPMPDVDVVVEAPPEVPQPAAAHPLGKLMPAVMALGAVGMMVVYYTSGAARSPMFTFFPVMMVISMLGHFAVGGRGVAGTAEVNRGRREYLRYLESVEATAVETAHAQRIALVWNHPDPGALWALVGTRRMWERRPGDPDFGHARVGRGEHRLSTRLLAPDLGPIDEADPVTSSALRQLIRRRSTVSELPITVAFSGVAAMTMGGDISDARALVRAMICQLAVLHSPQHLRVVAVVDPLAAPGWEWLKWLPHHGHPDVYDDIGCARLTFDSLASAEDALTGRQIPAIIVVDGGLIAGGERFLRSTGLPITVVELGTSCHEMASVRLHVADGMLAMRSDGDDEVLATADTMTVGQALACARRMSRYRPVRARGTAHEADWSQLMGIGDPGELDPAVHWRSRGPDNRLRVPIGVSEDGSPVEVDIKEAAVNGMGPHGLCIGATGSGKSEFLRTLTLGMITSHPPETLNLVLVDFKGGATFLGLERAPHVAAVITNLADEAHLVARMRDALAGELNRRQELLRAAGNFANLADYDRARAGGQGMAPLPVLFIVVDEFSELLSQQPDFMDLFVAIARLGRSLGIHLLLASQRLDEGRLRGLESHLSYRICLRTFSASESRSVLGVPDAYHLPSAPGAAYLKTGSDEPLRFQSAFVSAPYRVDNQRPAAAAGVPRLFTVAPAGRLAHDALAHPGEPSSRTVLDTVIDRLDGHGRPAHRVWLPPLADSPRLEDVLRHNTSRVGLTAAIGVVDCPFEQRQDLLVAVLGGAAGNIAVVGGPQAGKSTALRTLVQSLAESHHPRDVQIYCLDFGGGGLGPLRSLPHVGTVAHRHDTELVRRTVVQLESLLRAREAGSGNDPYGDVFLVVDGWATIRQEFDTVEASITALAAKGLSYRIHVVISASRWAEIRPALKDQIGTRIELRLGDPAESEMDRKRARQLAQSPPGRGITREGREFVIAFPAPVDEAVDRVKARWAGCSAPPVELLPGRLNHQDLIARSDHPRPSARVLLGLGEVELQPVAVDFAAESHLIILGDGECGKTATLRMLCREIVRTNTADTAELFIVDYRRTLLGVVESDHLAGYLPSEAALAARMPTLVERLRARMPGADISQHQLRTRSWWSGPEIYLVVDDYDLVAGTNGGNPLTPVLDLLPHAKDLGLHVVVARRSGGAARALFDPILARLRDLGCMGLMMSARPDEGVLLGSVRPSHLPCGRGTLITRSHGDELIQVAWSPA